jgi:hypothetical protein
VTLKTLRGSALGLLLASLAWSAGCATAPRPMVDPVFAAGTYSPSRIALLPPDVFVVLDQVGDNDPVQSAALGQAVSTETVRLVEQTLRSRGYDVDLSARWDGIVAQDGSVLVSRDELGWLANGVLQFANGPDGGGHGPMTGPRFVAPELAAKVGWATRSDALLYVNVKGVTTTNGKRTASVLAGVFIIVIVAALVLLIVAGSKGGNGSSSHPSSAGGGGFHGQPVSRAPSGGGGGWHGSPPGAGAGGGSWRGGGAGGGGALATPGGGGWRGGGASGGGAVAAPSAGSGWRGGGGGAGASPGGGGWRGGAPVARPYGAPVYGGRGPNLTFGVGIWVPLDGPVYTHDGNVEHDDEIFAGDELYVSMTLVSTYDGRIIWHARDHLDLDAEDNRDVDRMVRSFLDTVPPRAGFTVAAPPK